MNVVSTSATAWSGLLVGGDLSGAASLGVLVEASASTASKAGGAVLLDDVSAGTAERGSGVVSSEGTIIATGEVGTAGD